MSSDLSLAGAKSYNERMFSSGIRGKMHSARFEWLVRELLRRGITGGSVFELGCHDARTIDFLESAGFKIDRFLGVDANEHGGVEMAQERFGSRPGYEFIAGMDASVIPTPEKPYDLFICMETFEHIPEAGVEQYLKRVKDVVKGTLFITVPIERGGVFLAKNMARSLIAKEHRDLSRKEYWAHVFGRMDDIRHDGHIGFDDRRVVRQVRKYFQIEKVSTIGPSVPIKVIGFQRGIIARSS